MKTVVTGAAGFIGRWVVKDLVERGHDVVGFDNLSNGSRDNVEDFSDKSSFELVKGDVRNEVEVSEVLEDADVCIHLAAKIDVQESIEDPKAHFEANIVGTQNVLEACRKNDTRLSLVGTCMVYDVANSDGGIDEEHPVKPASPYAGSKLASENMAESYYHAYDLPVTILRPFNTYGPFQKTDMEGGVVSIFTSRDIEGKKLKIFGDGTQTRDLMYVTDCARFIVDGTLEEDAIGEVINAGTGHDVSINELAELVATGETDIEHVEHHHPQSEIQKLQCDPTKANELLGWEPEVSLKEGVENLREWLNT
jgi:nucleoside-diphosphate-sugar epimerase